jgi:hypothetical protein
LPRYHAERRSARRASRLGMRKPAKSSIFPPDTSRWPSPGAPL